MLIIPVDTQPAGLRASFGGRGLGQHAKAGAGSLQRPALRHSSARRSMRICALKHASGSQPKASLTNLRINQKGIVASGPGRPNAAA